MKQHTENIFETFKNAQQYKPDEYSRTYNCRVLKDDADEFVGKCNTRYGAWDFRIVESIRDEHISRYLIDANLKNTPHTTEFICDNSPYSRKKCNVIFANPEAVNKYQDYFHTLTKEEDPAYPPIEEGELKMNQLVYEFGRVEGLEDEDAEIYVVERKDDDPQTTVVIRKNDGLFHDYRSGVERLFDL